MPPVQDARYYMKLPVTFRAVPASNGRKVAEARVIVKVEAEAKLSMHHLKSRHSKTVFYMV
jgi:hypothetical protein